MSGKMPENPLKMGFKRNLGRENMENPAREGEILAAYPRVPERTRGNTHRLPKDPAATRNTHRLPQKKTPSQREGVSYLYGSNELTAEVVE